MKLAIARLAFRMELRLLSREWSTRLLLGILTFLFLYSVSNGAANWKRALDDGAAADAKAEALLTKWQDEVRTGKMVTSGARGSKANTPYFASAQRLPYSIRPNPLLMLEPTALSSRSWVDQLSAWSSKQDLFRHDDLANPLLMQSGSLDVNLLAVFVLPLVLCALAMRGQAEDRTNEIYRWMQTLSGEGVSIQFGKLCAALVLGLVPVWAALAAVFAFGLGAATQLGGLATASVGWLLCVVFYAAIWLGLFSWIAQRKPSASSYLTHSIAVWMVWAVLLPAARGMLLDRLTPAPDATAMIVFRQGLDTRMGKLRGSAPDMVRHKHPEWFGAASGDPREISILSSFLVAEEELRQSYMPFQTALENRARLNRRLAWMSPCLLAADQLRAIAGEGDYEVERERIHARLAQLRSILFPMILQGRTAPQDLYSRMLALRRISPAYSFSSP